MTTDSSPSISAKIVKRKRRRKVEKPLRKKGAPFLGWPTYAEAKVLVRARGIGSKVEYHKWIRRERIKFLPGYPYRVYAEWVSWNEFLGTDNRMRNDIRKKEYLPWWESVRWVHASGIKNWADWKVACRAGRVPEGIPHWPNVNYKDDWDADVWFGKTVLVRVDSMIAEGVYWYLVRMEGEPENVVWFLKGGKGDIKDGWKVLRTWEYEADLEDVAWAIVRSMSSSYYDEEQRLCANVSQMVFALDSKLLMVRK